MSGTPTQNLVTEMTAACEKGPFFFYDLVREFSSTPYRDILIAWGMIRERVLFDRDEEGHYICQTVKEKP